jgi:magnesium chelatase family protein
MIGGGKDAKTGEITLAHLGILFMDELPEFQLNVLEALRQPIEDREVSISRVNNHVSYPSDFQLIAAMNPCKCGYFGSNRLQCNRAPKCAQDYKNKISGPLFDRFDLQIEVAEIDMMDTQCYDLGETSEQVLRRVNKAQLCQKKRYEGLQIRNNSQLEGKKLEEFININQQNQEIIKKAMEKFNLSMRGLSKVLKIARTIADLDGDDVVTPLHIGEALSYRIKVKG